MMEIKMKKFIIPCLLFVAFWFSSCEHLILGPDAPKPPQPKKYSSRFETILDSLRYALDIPALAGAIVSDTGIIEAEAAGCRHYGGEENVTINDCFHLGSNGKSFTAVLIGVLVDEGKFNWSTTLPEIYSEYAGIIRDEYKTSLFSIKVAVVLITQQSGLHLKSISAFC